MNEVWLGDFAQCLLRLGPLDEAQVATVARLLGFEYTRERPVSESPHEDDTGQGPAYTEPATPRGRYPAAGRSLVDDPIARERLTPIERRAPPPVPEPDTAIEPLAAYDPTIHGLPLPHEPLWDPRWTRELVAAAVATPTRGREVDVERVVETVARGRPLTALPRRRTRTLALGAQVLVDFSPAMDPFARDRAELVETIREVVGKNGTSVLRFSGSPGLAGARGRASWQPYRPPDPGIPVVALTDLGIGGIASDAPYAVADEWVALARELRRRDSHLLALVPYPPARWPALLRASLSILHWDRPTTVARVLASTRR